MYYQGENIEINVTSDSVTDLRNKNFKILVYPHYDKDNEGKTIIIDKSENIGIKEDFDNDKITFSFNIPYEHTKTMDIGDYDIEIMIEYENKTYRSIFQKTFAVSIAFSNAKNIE